MTNKTNTNTNTSTTIKQTRLGLYRETLVRFALKTPVLVAAAMLSAIPDCSFRCSSYC
jgi:hypothetical protein